MKLNEFYRQILAKLNNSENAYGKAGNQTFEKIYDENAKEAYNTSLVTLLRKTALSLINEKKDPTDLYISVFSDNPQHKDYIFAKLKASIRELKIENEKEIIDGLNGLGGTNYPRKAFDYLKDNLSPTDYEKLVNKNLIDKIQRNALDAKNVRIYAKLTELSETIPAEKQDEIIKEAENIKPTIEYTSEEINSVKYPNEIEEMLKGDISEEEKNAIEYCKNITAADPKKMSLYDVLSMEAGQAAVEKNNVNNLKEATKGTPYEHSFDTVREDRYLKDYSKEKYEELESKKFKFSPNVKEAMIKIMKMMDENNFVNEENKSVFEEGTKVYAFKKYAEEKEKLEQAIKNKNTKDLPKLVESYKAQKLLMDNMLNVVHENFLNDGKTYGCNVDVSRNSMMDFEYRKDVQGVSQLSSLLYCLKVCKIAGCSIEEFVEDPKKYTDQLIENQKNQESLESKMKMNIGEFFAEGIKEGVDPLFKLEKNDLLSRNVSIAGRAIEGLPSFDKDNLNNNVVVANASFWLKQNYLTEDKANYTSIFSDNKLSTSLLKSFIYYGKEGTKPIDISPSNYFYSEEHKFEVPSDINDYISNMDNKIDYAKMKENIEDISLALAKKDYPHKGQVEYFFALHEMCDNLEKARPSEINDIKSIRDLTIESIAMMKTKGVEFDSNYKAEIKNYLDEKTKNTCYDLIKGSRYDNKDEFMKDIMESIKTGNPEKIQEKFDEIKINLINDSIKNNPIDVNLENINNNINSKLGFLFQSSICANNIELVASGKVKADSKDNVFVFNIDASLNKIKNDERLKDSLEVDSERYLKYINEKVEGKDNRIDKRIDEARLLITNMPEDKLRTNGINVVRALQKKYESRSRLWRFFNYFGQGKKERDGIEAMKNFLMVRGVGLKELNDGLAADEKSNVQEQLDEMTKVEPEEIKEENVDALSTNSKVALNEENVAIPSGDGIKYSIVVEEENEYSKSKNINSQEEKEIDLEKITQEEIDDKLEI